MFLGRRTINTVCVKEGFRGSTRANPQKKKGNFMLSWTLTFLVIALIAGLLGFAGIAGTAAGIAKILFLVFLVMFILSFLLGRRSKV
jgi:uncharacterized membrane protein YtjA (UPF0391 family)